MAHYAGAQNGLDVKFQFPEGQGLVVDTPSNFDSFDITFDCRFDDGIGDLLSNDSPVVSVEGNAAAEALSALAQTHFRTDGDPDIRSLVTFRPDPGETYIFNSITITTSVPAEYDVIFNNAFADVSEVEFDAMKFSGTAADPGNWASSAHPRIFSIWISGRNLRAWFRYDRSAKVDSAINR